MKIFEIKVRICMLHIFGDKFIDRTKLEQDIESERARELRIQKQQRLESEKQERERQERERQERLRLELERQERERRRLELQRKERERRRLELEKQERERQERLRLELERQERENHHRLINNKYNEIMNDIPTLFRLDNNKLDKIKNSDNEKCIICLEDFKINEQCLYLNCLHLFHARCIIEWLLKHDNCPICKECYKIDDDKLNAFLKSNTNTNINNNTQIQIQPNNNNNDNAFVINNNILNLIIQENDVNNNRYGRGYNHYYGHRRGGNYRGRGYHSRYNRRGNWK